ARLVLAQRLECRIAVLCPKKSERFDRRNQRAKHHFVVIADNYKRGSHYHYCNENKVGIQRVGKSLQLGGDPHRIPTQPTGITLGITGFALAISSSRGNNATRVG